MDASELVIGMPYVYRTKKGKDMVVTFTDETYDGRYVFPVSYTHLTLPTTPYV